MVGEIPAELTIQVIVSAIVAVMGTGTLITTLCASIFATICPVEIVVACAALILIATIWIVDMYCSYYDYIYSGDLDSYNDTSNMAMQLYMLGDMQLMASQFIFAHYAAPYFGKTKGESTGGAGGNYNSVNDVVNYIKQYGRLPENYITKREARTLGWDPRAGNLNNVAPNKTIGGDIYYNREGKLPILEGRIYYEADINCSGGYRGDERLIYSNDGLFFITSDHYQTFTQIGVE